MEKVTIKLKALQVFYEMKNNTFCFLGMQMCWMILSEIHFIL